MKIDSRLSRLEQRAKRTLKCDWCRYALHDTPPSKRRKYDADPNSRISVFCPHCGTEYSVDVSGLDQYEREATILHYKREKGALYREEQVYAAIQWLLHSRLLKLWRSGDLDKEKAEARKKAKEQDRYQKVSEKKKDDRYTRERAELKGRAYRFIQRAQEKEEKEYAPHTFPLAAEVERIEKPDSLEWIPGTYKKMEYEEAVARRVLYNANVMESCESVLWGSVLPDTDAAITELKSTIQRVEDERAQKMREEEEEKARREAERERERLERLAALKPAIPQTQSPFDSPYSWEIDNVNGGYRRIR